ncbi:hypothetical protein [Pseudooceanicola atlanticus]|uniref:Lipoprotein n=1 Tax=Pseudooceanicola atlanticus TaxID=1461694 RepID=A0A0A0EKI8_9RHOB|nr:hypothetical protein [Pseudooceanicola atlanticus]KGM50683.1 hypothetical protein ATO9_04225 [Pseudooceanicola atlanticus]
MKLQIALAATLIMSLSGCVNDTPVTTKPTPILNSERLAVEAKIKDQMRDPESTRFRGWQAFSLSNSDRVLCAEVNSKNGFGGYVGYVPLYARVRGSSVLAFKTDVAAQIACQQAASGDFMIASNPV